MVNIPTTTPPASTPPSDGTCSYAATFLGDVTVPDNTIVAPDASFVKTWRLRNDGTCSWGTAGFALHSLVFVGGSQLGAPNPVQLPASEVRQGSTVDISVPMIAPSTPGIYKSEWMLQVDNGPSLGVGSNRSNPLYAQIVVGGGATPTPPPSGGTTRLNFELGATDTVVTGGLAAGQSQDYVLAAQQGQTMMLQLSASGKASVTAVGAQGANPQNVMTSSDGMFWRGVLPVTEDYVIRVTAGSAPVNFSLDIAIPARITFPPGTTGITITGTTSERRIVTYLLRANAGQTMTVNLSAPPNAAVLTIYGLSDGNPLVNGNMSGATSWSGQLPGSEDYVIQVMPVVDGTVNYSLQAIVQ